MFISATEIIATRKALGLNQADFARLLGTHVMTISKWERGVAQPTAYQAALIAHFKQRTSGIEKEAQSEVKKLLIGAGVIAALAWLFASGRN